MATHNRSLLRRLLGVALVVAAALVLASCYRSDRGRMTIVVAAGDTPEQQILGQLTLQLLDAYGYTVEDKTDLGDLWMVRSALENNKVDIYWDYTGDTWMNQLGHDLPVADPQELYRRVRDDDAFNQVTWLLPAPASRAWGLVMSAEGAAKLETPSITGLVAYVQSVNPDLTLCTPAAMYSAVNGVRGLERATGLSLPDAQIHQMSLEEGYQAVADGTYDCALATSMSPELGELGLVTLNDDTGFFAASNLAVAVRTPVISEFPELEPTLVQLSARLTTDQMLELVRQVTVEGKTPERVARRFLSQQDLLKPHRVATSEGG